MLLHDKGNEIYIYFPYSPENVKKIKSCSGAVFHKDLIEPYWTIPSKALPELIDKFKLTLGVLYPNCTKYVNPDYFNKSKIEIKYDRVMMRGSRSAYFSKCILDLCSVEYQEKDAIVKTSLAEEIYSKNNTVVIKFPPGLYWRVLDFLKLFNAPLVIYPHPKAPGSKSTNLSVKARPYQQDTVDKILNKEIPSRGTLVMATGSGKTIMSAMITAALGLNTIFYTYSLDLLEQTAEVYEDLFQQKIGRVGGDYFDIQPITIATIQTVHSCYDKQDERWQILSGYLETVDLAFVDEGHMLGADTIFTVAKITNSHYSYALTATPFREDGKQLLIEAGTGPIYEVISEEALVKGGYILPVTVKQIPVRHTAYKGKRYNTIYKNNIVNNSVRNNLIASIMQRYSNKQVIVLVDRIEHGEILTELTSVPFIHGNSSDRKELLAEFKNKQIPALIASSILKQGVDIPDAEVLILAHGGVSSVELLQKIGRVRRPAFGKKEGIVVDFFDYCPTESNDVLRRQSERRLSLYKISNFKIDKPIGQLDDVG